MGPVKQSRYSPGARLHNNGGVGLVRRLSGLLTSAPARIAAVMFVLVIAIFTALLAMPFSSATGQPPPWLTLPSPQPLQSPWD